MEGPGLNMQYATASDCFVSAGCRKGTFNVNLTGTGFTVDPEVIPNISPGNYETEYRSSK